MDVVIGPKLSSGLLDEIVKFNERFDSLLHSNKVRKIILSNEARFKNFLDAYILILGKVLSENVRWDDALDVLLSFREIFMYSRWPPLINVLVDVVAQRSSDIFGAICDFSYLEDFADLSSDSYFVDQVAPGLLYLNTWRRLPVVGELVPLSLLGYEWGIVVVIPRLILGPILSVPVAIALVEPVWVDVSPVPTPVLVPFAPPPSLPSPSFSLDSLVVIWRPHTGYDFSSCLSLAPSCVSPVVSFRYPVRCSSSLSWSGEVSPPVSICSSGIVDYVLPFGSICSVGPPLACGVFSKSLCPCVCVDPVLPYPLSCQPVPPLHSFSPPVSSLSVTNSGKFSFTPPDDSALLPWSPDPPWLLGSVLGCGVGFSSSWLVVFFLSLCHCLGVFVLSGGGVGFCSCGSSYIFSRVSSCLPWSFGADPFVPLYGMVFDVSVWKFLLVGGLVGECSCGSIKSFSRVLVTLPSPCSDFCVLVLKAGGVFFSCWVVVCL